MKVKSNNLIERDKVKTKYIPVFSKKFTSLLKINKIQKNTIAKKLNISSNTVSAYTNKLMLPTLVTLINIADEFNVSIDDLLGRTGNYEPIKYYNETEEKIKELEIKIQELKKELVKEY